jgi:hypothetical protein
MITINLKQIEVDSESLAYDEIVRYADLDPVSEPDVSYRERGIGGRFGTLHPGQTVEDIEGLNFHVSFGGA